MLHFAQMVNSGKFQKYDYGWRENKKKYGQDDAPLYDLEKMQVATHLFSGGKDSLADPTDVKEMVPKIANLKGNFEYPDFNHLDFIWGLRAATDVYQKILDIINDS